MTANQNRHVSRRREVFQLLAENGKFHVCERLVAEAARAGFFGWLAKWGGSQVH